MANNEELVKQYQTGDLKTLDELTKQNMGLIRFVANKFYTNCSVIDNEDLIQQGWIGFFRAIKTYRADLPNRAKFSSWAIYWIRAAISRYLTQKTPKDETSIYELVAEDLTLGDTIEDFEASRKIWDYIDKKELRQELESVMYDILPLKQREIIKLRHGWNDDICWSLEDIGKIYDLTWENVKAVYEKAIYQIRCSKWARLRIKEKLDKERAAAEYQNMQKTAFIDFSLENI